MAESREKSQELRKQFEECVTEAAGGAIGALLDRCSNEKFADEYACSDVQMAWGAFQFGEEIGREAGRRDALEEQWISVEEKLPELYVTVLFDARNSGAEKGMRIDGGKWRLERTDPQDETIEFADEEVIGWMQIPPRAWRVK